MKLSTAQSEFTELIGKLIQYIYASGYTCSFGDSYRDPRVHGAFGEKVGYSHPRSVHKLRLAVDFNLFEGGVYLEGTEAHRQFGEWWEQQHPLARWGGRFNDGNHYSFEWEGVK